MADLFSPATAPTGPHTSRSAPETSRAAADRVKPHLPTIRARVLAFAHDRGAAGFVDEELIALGADQKQGDRSVRPRRTELTDEGWIVDSGRRSRNASGNECVVWVHRDFHPNPPALRERERPERDDGLRPRARKMAADLARYAESMRREGRTMFAAELEAASELMAALAR